MSALLERLEVASPGDAIDVATFKLADRGVIEALLAAAARGVTRARAARSGRGSAGRAERHPQPAGGE